MKIFIGFLFLLCLQNCLISNEPHLNSNPWQPSPDELVSRSFFKKMQFIKAKGHSFIMGSDHGNEFEAPAHLVEFTYDFWMDATEVTIAEFGFWDSSFIRTKQWRTPIEVKFFNAIKHCNERSKFFGFDTVYTYEENHPRLSEISTKTDVMGFRLPTEAEWEYSANAGSTNIEDFKGDDFSFEERNDFREVGLMAPNSYGLFDMLNNLCEHTTTIFGIYLSAEKKINPWHTSLGYVGTLTRAVKGCGTQEMDRDIEKFYIRPSYRHRKWQTNSAHGFRCVLPVLQNESKYAPF